jgi:hypothetical protein
LWLGAAGHHPARAVSISGAIIQTKGKAGKTRKIPVDASLYIMYSLSCQLRLIFERKGVMLMNLLIYWLIQLTDNFALLFTRQGQIEKRLDRLEKEVKALRQQRP